MDQIIIFAILIGMLGLFVDGRIRPDAVALLGLLACNFAGLLTVRESLSGFSSRAVVTVAAVLVIGRVLEVTGAATAFANFLIPRSRSVALQFGAVLVVGAVLSAFVNNIAALVIMLPATIAVAKQHRLPPSALLMALAFATVLGGMTTLIGTPGNLILSSVREDALGAPYGLFDMSYVGGTVAAGGLIYLLLAGWRLTPQRPGAEQLQREVARVFETELPDELEGVTIAELRKILRLAGGVPLALFRRGKRFRWSADTRLQEGDRLLIMSRRLPWDLARDAGLKVARMRSTASDAIVAQVTVSHGSRLIGLGHDAVAALSRDRLHAAAVGPRPAKLKQPLEQITIQPGDQLFIDGPASVLRPFLHDMRLLEIGHEMTGTETPRNAVLAFSIYVGAVFAAGFFSMPLAIVMLVAALTMALLRLIPSEEIYKSIDWPIIVLLSAMIPIGRAFGETGATQTVADALSWGLASATLPITVATLCIASMILSSFLNNVATALVMGEVAVGAALNIGLNVDAALLAVLIGSSCSFLTPIGHQNNLLVMKAGGYQFVDYARVGIPLTIIVVAITTYMLSGIYG